MTEKETKRIALRQIDRKLERILRHIKTIDKDRKFQSTLDYKIFSTS